MGQKLPDDWKEKKISFLKLIKEEITNYALKPLEAEKMNEFPISSTCLQLNQQILLV